MSRKVELNFYLLVLFLMFYFIIVNIVDVRFGRRDAEDHLFVRIGDDWSGDKKSGLIYGHVSVLLSYLLSPNYFRLYDKFKFSNYLFCLHKT